MDLLHSALRQVIEYWTPSYLLASLPLEEHVERVLDFCRREGDSIVFTENLPSFRAVHSCPPLLFVRGNPKVLDEPCFSIVGSRQASLAAHRASLRFARDLSLNGFTIVSGFAAGVDSAAHRGALLAGGKTVGVLGHGLQIIYPSQNRSMVAEILRKDGALITEFPPGAPPLPHHFPIRNRLIAGMSLGTLVVQAKRKSGSMITARLAAEQGREVFVLPGSFEDDSYQGSFQLIQQGAKLIYDIEGILEELPSQYRLTFDSGRETYVSGARALFPESGQASLSELVDKTGLSQAEVAAKIEKLKKERSVVESFPGIYVALDK